MSLLYLSSITILLGSQELPDSSVIPQAEGQKKKKKNILNFSGKAMRSLVL